MQGLEWKPQVFLIVIHSLGDIAETSCEIGKVSTYFFTQNY